MKLLAIAATRYQAYVECQAVEQWKLRLWSQLPGFKSQLGYLGAM